MEDKLAPGQALGRLLRGFPLSIIPKNAPYSAATNAV